MFSSTLKWIENVKSLPNSQSRRRRTLTIENSLFISFHVLLFQSDRLPSTAHQSQFFQSSLFFISFLLHFKIAWNTFEARLLIGQQNNCARERVSLWIFDWSQTRFDRQHISIGSNNVYGTKRTEWWSEDGGSSSFRIEIYRHRHINVGMHKL